MVGVMAALFCVPSVSVITKLNPPPAPVALASAAKSWFLVSLEVINTLASVLVTVTLVPPLIVTELSFSPLPDFSVIVAVLSAAADCKAKVSPSIVT